MADELIALFGKITTNDHDELVEQFSKILQVQPNVATFFLEASSWSVETAVHNYLASVDSNNGPMISTPPKAQFLGDLSPLQNRALPGNTRFNLRLSFRNTGTEHWPADTRLSFVDGDSMDGPSSIRVAAPPGADVMINLELISPEKSGTHMGSWRLACNAGYFGEPVYIILAVDQNLSVDMNTNRLAQMQVHNPMNMSGDVNMGNMHSEPSMHRSFMMGTPMFGTNANGIPSSMGNSMQVEQSRQPNAQQQQQQEDADMLDL